ncbi:MAG TPA: peptidylprolyl isomerase [Gemmatimonadaceae bacterium]|nr:peptidylprolyl isomerase [Gemmatimonadaceae bacterium]
MRGAVATLALAVLCSSPGVLNAQTDSAVRPVPRDATQRIFIDRIIAIVGNRALTYTELVQAYYQEAEERRQRNAAPLPRDTNVAKRYILDGMIDAELLHQQAIALKLVAPEDKINSAVDARIAKVREDFAAPGALRAALAEQGFTSLDEFRKMLADNFRRAELRPLVIDTLQKLGRMPRVAITEQDIKAAFDSTNWENKGPTVTFRQIVMRIEPSATALARAKAVADSLILLMNAGADFDSLARKISADSVSAAQGGDVGWFRRGKMTKAFEDMAFSLPIERISPPVLTEYGYHIIRVDRVRAGEVKARHILIPPVVDSSDIAKARAKGDSVAATLRAGASFDSLATIYHDAKGREELLFNDPFPVVNFPEFYAKAVGDLKPKEVSNAFEIPTPQGPPKIGIVQIMTRNESGVATLDEKRDFIRRSLQEQGSARRLLDALRKEIYVEIRLDEPKPGAGSGRQQ